MFQSQAGSFWKANEQSWPLSDFFRPWRRTTTIQNAISARAFGRFVESRGRVFFKSVYYERFDEWYFLHGDEKKKWLHTWRGRPRLGRLPWGPRQGEAGHWPPPPRPTGKSPKSSWQLKTNTNIDSLIFNSAGFAWKCGSISNLCQRTKFKFWTFLNLNYIDDFIIFLVQKDQIRLKRLIWWNFRVSAMMNFFILIIFMDSNRFDNSSWSLQQPRLKN